MTSKLNGDISADQVAGADSEKDPIEALGRQLLIEIGEDPDREGLRDTPKRYARWWREFMDYDPGSLATVFNSSANNQLVLVSDMLVWSLCEHHLLPFSCSITIGYRADGTILGLSKFARIAHKHAHRLQVQEQLIAGIADEITYVAGSPDVAVVGRGEHSCMITRGIRTEGTMTSTDLRGIFATDSLERAELLALAQGSIASGRRR